MNVLRAGDLADQAYCTADVTGRLAALKPGGLLTLIGIDAADLAGLIPPSGPPMLGLDLAGIESVGLALDRILDDLADLALAAWPNWSPSPLAPWRRAADRLAATGRRPRFSQNVPAATQFCALHPAAGAPALIFPLDPGRPLRAGPLIATLEWVRRHGAAAIALLPEPPAPLPPWDRVLHGSITISPPPKPAASRLLPQPQPGLHGPDLIGPHLFGSVIERRMRAALHATPDLAGLFENEITLDLGPLGPAPRVDLLWRAGKIVVELDGAEHERDPNYGADRHRDYELLVAGYLVLRLTNAEIELDLARALDKIRRVVALRRLPA
jgi:hypothetical protein